MKKKWKWFIIVLAVLALLTGYDWWRSNQVILTAQGSSSGMIDTSSAEATEIVVNVRNRKGEPVTDHNIYALAVGGGSFKSFYEKTDDSGRVTFVYYPPKMAGYQTEKSVTLKFRDESNSVFIEIYPSMEYTIELTRQEESGGMPVGDFLN